MAKQMQKTQIPQKKQGWKLWLGLAIGAAMVGASWLIWTQIQEPEVIEVEKIVEKEIIREVPVPADDEAEFKTYTNDELGFSFQYPADYTIEQDLLATPGQLESMTQPLRLINNNVPENPTFEVWVNPPGTESLSDFMEVFELQNNSLSVVDKLPVSPPFSTPDNGYEDYFFRTDPTGRNLVVDGNSYIFKAKFKEGGESYEQEFIDMVESFRFQ